MSTNKNKNKFVSLFLLLLCKRNFLCNNLLFNKNSTSLDYQKDPKLVNLNQVMLKLVRLNKKKGRSMEDIGCGSTIVIKSIEKYLNKLLRC